MLDLQARVHFHEVEGAILREGIAGDELNGAGTDVANGLGGIDRGLAHRRTPFRRHARRRRFFKYFLVTALHRAVALEQINAVTLRIGKNLYFDVPRTGQVLFDQHVFGAK